MKNTLKKLRKYKKLTMLLPGILVAALVVGILQAGLPEAMVKTNNEAPSQKTATKEKAKKKKRSAAAAAMKSGGGKAGGPSGGGGFHHDGNLDGQKFKDGSYEGSAQGFKGTVTSRVTIAKGKINRIVTEIA